MSIIISIVIPIFNARSYLEDCLDSITCEHINDIEIILIDDGSYDGSTEIAIEYANSYRYIRFFYQSNQGVFIARNNGLIHATGTYVIFLDADDYLMEGSIEYLTNFLRKKSYDIIFLGTKLIGKKSFLKTKPYLPKYSIGSNVSKVMFLDNKAIAGYMGGKLIKTSVAKQALSIIKYKDIRIELYEDCLFLFCVATYCKTSFTIDKNLYVYRIHESSVTQIKIVPQRVIEKLKVSKCYFKDLKELPVVQSHESHSQSLIKINRIIDSSILIQRAKRRNYIKNIYKAWLLDSRFVNLARIIIYVSTFGAIKK